MKLKNIAKKLFILSIISIVLTFSIFCVSGVGEETTETVISPVTEVETTVPQTSATMATTAPTTVATEPVTEKHTETEQATVQEETEKETQAETQATSKQTYATTEAVTYSLPPAPVDTSPTAIVVPEEQEVGDLTYGIVSWVCVIAGVLVVVIVLISNKTQYHSGSGKHRYKEGNKITGQKRLLNDEYYNNRKSESYFSKDTRK